MKEPGLIAGLFSFCNRIATRRRIAQTISRQKPHNPKHPFASVPAMISRTRLALSIAAILAATPARAQIAPHAAVPDATHILTPPAAPQHPAPHIRTPRRNLGLPPPKAGARFTKVRVIGARALKAHAIAALFAPLQGRDADAASLQSVLDKIDALYLAAGYPLGRAYVPAQVMRGGTLTVRVVEGYVANIVVQADTNATRTLVKNIAAHLTEEKPLTRRTLQRYMLILQGLPGITLGSKFQSMDPLTGAVTLVISAAVKPAAIAFYMDNRANLDRLPFQPYLMGTLNDLVGAGDQTSLTALLSPRQKDYAFYNIGYSRPVGTEGLTMGFHASWAQTRDSRTFAPYDVRSQTSQLAQVSRYPLLRATDEQLNIDGKVYYTHTGYSFAGIPIAHDNFAALRLGGDYARSFSPDLAAAANLHLTRDIADTGPGPHTRRAVQTGFTKLQGEAKLAYRPFTALTLNLRAVGQYGSGSLYASEEIAFGGLQYGRGFDSAEISGDSGFGVTFQPEYSLALDWGGFGRGSSLTPYLLIDYARTFNTKGDGEPEGELVSAGIGLRLAASDLFSISLEVDKPLNRIPLFRRDRNPRFYTSLQLGLDRAISLIAGTP
jgi:hemolysin activation/secretion protein